MLSMSLDSIENKANHISLHLKDISVQFKQPAKVNAEHAKNSIKQLIEEMHELDDMVHEPAYESGCLLDYWTLTSLHGCWTGLKEVLDLLEAHQPSEKTLANVQLKMNDVNYLWHDNFRPDLDGFLNRVSALNQPSLDEESYSSFSFGSVLHKPKNPFGYGLPEKKNATDEQTLNSGFAATSRLG